MREIHIQSSHTLYCTHSMYIWRKNTKSDWLRIRGDDLIRRFGSDLAIVERPGNARTLLDDARRRNGQRRPRSRRKMLRGGTGRGDRPRSPRLRNSETKRTQEPNPQQRVHQRRCLEAEVARKI